MQTSLAVAFIRSVVGLSWQPSVFWYNSVHRSEVARPSDVVAADCGRRFIPRRHASQRASNTKRQPVILGDPDEGITARPIGQREATSIGVSSTARISLQIVELLGWIHRRPIRMLLDSGSTGSYISD